MVKYSLLLFFLVIPMQSYARDKETGVVTPNDVRALIREAEREKAAREKRFHTNVTDFIAEPEEEKNTKPSVSKPIQKKNQSQNAATVTPAPEKQSATPSVSAPRPKQISTPKATQRAKRDPNIYIAPVVIDSGGSNVSVDFDKPKQQSYYGIPIGTWVDAELPRTVTSADRSPIEIVLKAPISGKRRDLPAYTTVFGHGSFNTGTGKLDISISNGITEDGIEFNLSASVYDQNKVAGLSGIVIKDYKDDFEDAGKNAAFTVVDEALNSIRGNDPVSAGLNAGTNTILNRAKPDTRPDPKVIRVPKQKIKIRIDKTF